MYVALFWHSVRGNIVNAIEATMHGVQVLLIKYRLINKP